MQLYSIGENETIHPQPIPLSINGKMDRQIVPYSFNRIIQIWNNESNYWFMQKHE